MALHPMLQFLPDITGSEALVLAGAIIGLVMLLMEFCGIFTIIHICVVRIVAGLRRIFSKLFRRNKITPPFAYSSGNGPSTWKYYYPDAEKCKAQSPINIITKNGIVIPAMGSSDRLRFMQEPVPESYYMFNTGDGVSICGYWPNTNFTPALTGGPLKNLYRFVGANFHWGPTDTEGTEHTIDNQRFALELQVVYVNDQRGEFKTLDDAASSKRIAIVTYLFKRTEQDNPFLEIFVSKVPEVYRLKTKYRFAAMPMNWLVPPFTKNYFYYQGSLTSPPCTESVKWIVQAEPLAVSSRQVALFRKVQSGDGSFLLSNSRPVQELRGRSVYFYD